MNEEMKILYMRRGLTHIRKEEDISISLNTLCVCVCAAGMKCISKRSADVHIQMSQKNNTITVCLLFDLIET